MPKLIVATEKTLDVPVEISLEPIGGRIRVRARRGSGDNWAIVDIKEDGSLYLHNMVGKDLGFKLNENGQVEIASSY